MSTRKAQLAAESTSRRKQFAKAMAALMDEHHVNYITAEQGFSGRDEQPSGFIVIMEFADRRTKDLRMHAPLDSDELMAVDGGGE